MDHPRKASLEAAHQMLKSVGLDGPQSLLKTPDVQEHRKEKRRKNYVPLDHMGVPVLPDDEREKRIRGY